MRNIIDKISIRGDTTITYPDTSVDTIPGDQLVQGQKGDTSDAGNITPTIPGGKVTVKDPSHLKDELNSGQTRFFVGSNETIVEKYGEGVNRCDTQNKTGHFYFNF